MVFRSEQSKFWFIASPSAREPGKIQLTKMEGDTPVGHTDWDSYDEAERSACGDFVRGQPPVGEDSYSKSEK